MENYVRFSIVVAWYKGQQYVDRLIRVAEDNRKSLTAGGCKAEVELVFVNDSPEVTIELPDIPEDIRVQVIEHQVNSGIHQARVTGLSGCRGDYVVFLDQDDELEKDALLNEWQAIGDTDAVVANARNEQADGSFTLQYPTQGDFRNALDLSAYIRYRNQIISPGHCLLRRSSIPAEWSRYIMKVNGSDDLFLWILMLSKKCTFTPMNKVVYTHHYTGSNLSAEMVKMAQSSLDISEALKEIPYVRKKDAEDFIRRRRMLIDLSKAGGVKKIQLHLQNLDLDLAVLKYKVRAGKR